MGVLGYRTSSASAVAGRSAGVGAVARLTTEVANEGTKVVKYVSPKGEPLGSRIHDHGIHI